MYSQIDADTFFLMRMFTHVSVCRVFFVMHKENRVYKVGLS